MSDGIGRKKRRIINAGLKTREQNEKLTMPSLRRRNKRKKNYESK